ncbi:hypothetical protein CathTA2_0148 [Caldalkalibacillus thermarum TA2.A1]|uniref:Efflux RND transporter periplasmic adaptor subunit n=1 Tax=Caldalkalibacillus thermarum (strain TA2.A1) TaxID=986075 RepID=F5L2Z0_CALTT|nr:efflux RND transporter periplasmic adaptor subunit [Caldalkalibacillus thermarum]EGL84293.1 hypothetical protein CathTA2_0148 [Caldalkalibacillus thermarum TA2.A1]QZT34056.1 efflux RND transporter periplasmic adaptor subunit [Caldalkalibacillus thermarum TA2.A1]
MGKKLLVMVAGLLGLGLFLALNAALGENAGDGFERPALNTKRLEPQTVEHLLPVEGQVVPAETQLVYLHAHPAQIEEIYVRAGDAVESGTPLFRYTQQADEQGRAWDIEEERLTLQRDHIDDLAGWAEDHISNLDKYIGQLEQRAAGAEEEEQNTGDQALLYDLLLTKGEWEYRQRELEFKRRLAETEKKQLEHEKQLAEQQSEDGIVYSRIDGIVTSIQLPEGSNGEHGKPFMTIESTEAVLAEARLSAEETAHLLPGQAVLLEADVLPEETFTGVVSAVYYAPQAGETEPEQEEQTGISTDPDRPYVVLVEVEQPATLLKHGYQVKMDITLETIEGAVVVPEHSIVHKDDTAYVYLYDEGTLTPSSTVTR